MINLSKALDVVQELFLVRTKNKKGVEVMSLENFIEAEIQKRIEKKISELQPKEIIKETESIKETLDEQLKLYSVADVAKLWHIEQSKIRKLIQIGEIRAIKFSKQGLKITAKELQRFLDENENNDFSNLLDC
ncbi:MAG: helix-turn-helix domain-containing protein [Intestinibacter bartlettii]